MGAVLPLFHGTSESRARAALAQGLLPRGMTGVSNWEAGSPSHPDAVYLTSTYPLWYAAAAVTAGERFAVIEVDRSEMDPTDFVPDEDVLAAVRIEGYETPPEHLDNQMSRASWFRDRLDDWRGRDDISLERLGTCAHFGAIPPSTITRVAFIDPEQPLAADLLQAALDATLSLQNFRYVSPWHQAIINYLFGNSLRSSGPMAALWQADIERLQGRPRTGIEVEEIGLAPASGRP